MKYLLLILITIFSIQSYAVELPPNNSWSWKHHEKMREKARLKAMLVKQINESGSSKTITAIVETRPTASKVGGAMLKRVTSAKGNVYAALGSYAVIELIEAIGWVMEDGTYVKYIDKDYPYYAGDFNDPVAYGNTKKSTCDNYASYYSKKNNGSFSGTLQESSCYLTNNETGNSAGWTYIRENSNYNPDDPNANKEKVPLTPEILGAAMLGTGYKDPDPKFDNSTVNNDQWTAVPEAYTPDDSGIGNELANELEDKADDAPQTPDKKPSSFTDPKYQNDLISNDKANDRSWDSGDGTEGSTDSTQTTNPDGTTTNTGSFKLPAFCDWAMTMCQWYKDWTSSDQVYKDHMTKTEEHQTEEKTFWEDVKDFFTFFTEEDNKDNEDTEVDIEEEDAPQLDTNILNASGECPPDFSYPFPLPLGGTYTITYSYATACYWFSKLYYIVVTVASLISIRIVSGTEGKSNG